MSKSKGFRKKSFSFLKGEKAAEFDAKVMMNALCKPWELGGHPRDFLVVHRSVRITDITRFYEQDRHLIKMHEKLVADKEAWNRKRAIREEMLQILTRLHSIEKKRHHFIEAQKCNHEEFPDFFGDEYHGLDIEEHANTQTLSLSFVDKKFGINPKIMTPERATSLPSRRSHLQSSMRGSLKSVGRDEFRLCNTPSQIAAVEKQEVEALDEFDSRIESLVRKGSNVGNGTSFRRNKQK